ncbi:MAG: DEAD/DEAH box helicase, partial [Leptolyngbyaceae bacterium]|nr:DEAD/DEAH box helicase [Leptolyngbyaceae bacterium]
IRFSPLAALALEEVLEESSHLKADKHWKEHIQRLKEVKNLQPELPSTLQTELRDYQIEGFQWLARLAHWGVGACLADDMGLGKTLQALTVILTRAPQGPTLIVAPTSVCMNWMSEAQRFAPTLQVIQLGGGDRQKLLDALQPFDMLVCSYGLLQQEEVAEMLAKVQWQTIVLDEAQAIKNVATKRSQAAMNLQAGFKLLTTGTPIENHLGELWNLFRFINPGLLGSLDSFNQRFAHPIERYQDKQARNRLKKLIQPFLLRRTKSQVLAELPSRTEITLHVDLSAEELALYEALRREAIAKLSDIDAPAGQKHLQVLAEIMKLRRACCNANLVMPNIEFPSSKLQLFGEVLGELLENRHKALVFSQFVDHLQIIRTYLDEQKIAYQYLDGSTPAGDRKKRVDAFQAGNGDVFLISLKAGGTGLNLTAADYVIHMDPWWNPAVEDQASDRAHRIGQQRPVTIYRLVAKNTIEEKIVELHQHKRDLADSLLEGSDMSGKISTEALLQLIHER